MKTAQGGLMIEINSKTKTILFGEKYVLGTPVEERLKSIECKLLMAYLCPFCKNILRVYFLTDKEIEYWKYEGAKNKEYSAYRGWTISGAQGLAVNHEDSYGENEYCGAKIFRFPSFEANLVRFLKEMAEIDPDGIDLTSVTDKLKQVKIKGFELAHDICEIGEPMIVFDEDKFIDRKADEDFDDWWKRKEDMPKNIRKVLGLGTLTPRS